MWARRLGVPHLWPSRVKVFFLGLLTSAFNFSVFQYLRGGNAEYLDLHKPASLKINCRLPTDACRMAKDPVSCTVLEEDQSFWRGMNLSNPCPLLPATLIGQTCRNPSLPLSAIAAESGSLHTVNGGANRFRLWSILFLVLTSLLSVSIVLHDLALLEERLRPRILSIPNMKYATPCLWEWLSCVQGRRYIRSLWGRNRVLWSVLVPIWTTFQMLFFMAVMYPVSFLVFLVAPVRMSRIMVFLSSILCMLWSIVFIVFNTLVDTQPYAVLWGVNEPRVGTCVCLCEFPINRDVLMRIVVLGIGVCWQSSNLMLRALRGLRRANWANMFSVLYAVPIEVFPVVWERPQEFGEGPIKWRCEGQAVQSEPAFDPFCLMDEQPESACTRAQIRPVTNTEQQHLNWEPYTGTLDTEIGCCGFPRPVASMSIWDRPEDTTNPEERPPPWQEDGGMGHVAPKRNPPVSINGHQRSVNAVHLQELEVDSMFNDNTSWVWSQSPPQSSNGDSENPSLQQGVPLGSAPAATFGLRPLQRTPTGRTLGPRMLGRAAAGAEANEAEVTTSCGGGAVPSQVAQPEVLSPIAVSPVVVPAPTAEARLPRPASPHRGPLARADPGAGGQLSGSMVYVASTAGSGAGALPPPQVTGSIESGAENAKMQ